MSMYKEMFEYLAMLGCGLREPQYKSFGLCFNFEDKFNITLNEIIPYFDGFPGFSGDPKCPVNGYNTYMNERDSGDCWKNPKRLEFCKWCASEIERMYLFNT